MKIRILSPAEEDLEEGYRFYELQSPGLGSYFLDSLYSDIDSLSILRGYSPNHFWIPPPALQAVPFCRVLSNH